MKESEYKEKLVIEIVEVKDSDDTDEYYIARAPKEFEHLQGLIATGDDPIEALMEFYTVLDMYVDIQEEKSKEEEDKKEKEEVLENQ